MLNYISRCSFRRFPIPGRVCSSKFSLMCQCPAYFRFSKLTSNLTIRQDVCRRNSSESGPPSNKLPPLMEFPKITWPSLIKSIRNFILATFIIKPYLDRDFNLPDFVVGSKKAVEVVSKKIAEGDVKALEGLVTEDILPTLQRAVTLMSLSQREQIAVEIDDIYFSFPYQIGVMFNEDNDQKRFVEITMVFHALKGLALMKSRGEEPPLNMGMLPEYQHRISICNYRFIKEFTKGVESDWTVNLLNHFKPIDEVQE
ncbi:m-AAA protease-interacting protein 1, mitochondrial-like [Tribolium madens]|uniref:m-AAA protease-interacting protein 1, mitochondrial-like n=1 Tax=Tribolium madens TaxID=41895 RepID=UPI001CF73F26|nr:m-AAA protease-interacting protein 1, mitochondrial-like [Tribolium madens]XP_044265890.1 m-AAA protease-interacting protein 1, mitochondrial-like [Tribolium madens]